MTSGEQPPPLRIGTAERTATMKALDEHLAAGRLGVEEYADRSAVAANATVASELAALFTDLPAPHPVLPGITPSVPAVLPVADPAVRDSAPLAERASNFFDGWGPRLVAVTPFVAVALFFITGSWVFFLLIPAMGALVYRGGVGRDHDDGHRGRDRDRDRRDRR